MRDDHAAARAIATFVSIEASWRLQSSVYRIAPLQQYRF